MVSFFAAWPPLQCIPHEVIRWRFYKCESDNTVLILGILQESPASSLVVEMYKWECRSLNTKKIANSTMLFLWVHQTSEETDHQLTWIPERSKPWEESWDTNIVSTLVKQRRKSWMLDKGRERNYLKGITFLQTSVADMLVWNMKILVWNVQLPCCKTRIWVTWILVTSPNGWTGCHNGARFLISNKYLWVLNCCAEQNDLKRLSF